MNQKIEKRKQKNERKNNMILLQKQTFGKISQKNYQDIKYKSLNKDRQVILLKFYYFLAPGHYENFDVKPPLHEETDLIRLT